MIKSEVIIRKVWRSEISSLTWFIISSILCVILSNKFSILTLRDHLFTIGNYKIVLVLPLLWFIPLISLMYAIYKIYNVKFKVDNRGVEATIGRLSMKQSVIRVRYEDIRAIDINQTLLERMLDIGTVDIGTAASGESEVYMIGIEAPYEIKDMLDRERDARQRKDD